MSKFKKYIDTLADSCKEAIQQMTNITIGTILIKEVDSEKETYPIAHKMAYFNNNKQIGGDFVLAFGNESTAIMLATGIGGQMGLSSFTQFDDDVVDLLNEFLNVVVGNAISKWDEAGLSVKFETPVLKKDIVLTGELVAPVYKITIEIKSNQDQLDELSQDLILYVTFIEAKGKNMKNMRILVVEDSKVMRGVIVKTLEEEGCKVKDAGDGVEAIDIHETFSPDLTLMDINMPNMGGLEAIENIRNDDPKAKFIIFSSSSKKEEVVTAGALGVMGYLIKPIKPELLVEKIKEILGINSSLT